MSSNIVGTCDFCGRTDRSVQSMGRDANGDPDAPDVCFLCIKEGERRRTFCRELGRYIPEGETLDSVSLQVKHLSPVETVVLWTVKMGTRTGWLHTLDQQVRQRLIRRRLIKPVEHPPLRDPGPRHPRRDTLLLVAQIREKQGSHEVTQLGQDVLVEMGRQWGVEHG